MSSDPIEMLRLAAENAAHVIRNCVKAGSIVADYRQYADDVEAALAALSAPQPPAESQPVAWTEKDGDEWIVYDADSDTGQHILNYQKDRHFRSVFPIYDHPPPSAPVGVEAEKAVQAIMHEVFKYADVAAPLRGPPMTQDESLPARRASLAQDKVIRDMLYALAQQPAAAPVSEAIASLPALWRLREDNGEEHTEYDKGFETASDECARMLEEALAQQPAADGGFTAADMMDARQEGRKEAQQPAADPLVEWANSPLNFTATVGVYKDGVQPAAVDEALRAEVARLQEELDNRWARGVHTCHDKCQRTACVLRRDNERLAEALRDIESRPWNGVRPIQIAARAALRDHDQEEGNG